MKRFNTFSSIYGVQKLVDFELTFPKEYGESVADATFFVPLSESVRSGSSNQGVYDFSNGQKDDGRSVPAARVKGSDIVDLQRDVEANEELIRNKVKKAAERKIIDQAIANASKSFSKGSDDTSFSPGE